MSGFGDTRAPHFISLCESAFSSSLSPVLFCARVLCFLLLHAVRVLAAACIHVMSCAVWHAACVFHWLRAFVSCVDTWLMSILISCMFVPCFAHGW